MTFLGLISFSNVMHDVRSLPSFPLRHCGMWCTKTQVLYLQGVFISVSHWARHCSLYRIAR